MPSDSRRNNEREDANARSSGGKRSRASWRDGLNAQESQREPQSRPERQHPETESSQHVSHKWRDMQRQTDPDDSGLPPLPGQRNGRRKKSGVGNKAIIFGALLLVIVAALMVLPFSPLVENDADPTPTNEVAQATVVATELPAGNETAVPTNEPAETVDSEFLVCIDPGHGGWDYGRERMDSATFTAPYFFESEVTLSMSFFLRDELEGRNIAVVMTRETGGAVNFSNEDIDGDGQVYDGTEQGRIAAMRDELQARINICNEAGADIMISIHLNGIEDTGISGYEIFFNSQREFAQQNRDLAEFLYREMGPAFVDLGYDANARGTTDDINLNAASHEYGSEQFLIMIGPEVRKPEYTITPTAMPGVIIETVFVTNTNDANFILNPANQKRLAVSWADGIERYREQYGD